MRNRTRSAGDNAGRVGKLARGALMLVALIAMVVTACTTAGPGGSQSLGQIKRSHYGAIAQQDAAGVSANTEQSVVEFTVESTPPSIFVNYVIPDAQAAAFEAFIDLPPAFSLAKLRILESDPTPQYWLSLNVYRVNGITTGLRAEWSTYVDDGSGTPRFMIVRARAAEGSLDPVGPLAFPEPFTHKVESGAINTNMRKTIVTETGATLTPNNLFTSSLVLPAPANRNYVEPTREWVAANDYIYWINGVNDRTYQNATAHSAPMISIDQADITLNDETPWLPFVDPTPAHATVYLEKLEFTISPWFNLTELDGRVDPAIVAARVPFKVSLYSGLANTKALEVKTGSAQAEVQTTIEGTPPSVDWHWKIPGANVAGLQAALGLPAGLNLTPVVLEEGEAADYWLSLNVHRKTGTESGLRAEWSTYVDDGKGKGPRNVIIEARADHASLDPVNLFTTPFPITHAVTGATVDTEVGGGATALTSSFTMPTPGTETTTLASREWVGANELRYWRNGIYDRVTHDSIVFSPKVSINPATVSITDGSQWASYVGATPDRVWVTQDSSGLVTNPWFNVGGG